MRTGPGQRRDLLGRRAARGRVASARADQDWSHVAHTQEGTVVSMNGRQVLTEGNINFHSVEMNRRLRVCLSLKADCHRSHLTLQIIIPYIDVRTDDA